MKSDCSAFRRISKLLFAQRGQGSSEYIVVVIAVGLALIVALKFTNLSVKCKFDLAFKQIFVGY